MRNLRLNLELAVNLELAGKYNTLADIPLGFGKFFLWKILVLALILSNYPIVIISQQDPSSLCLPSICPNWTLKSLG